MYLSFTIVNNKKTVKDAIITATYNAFFEDIKKRIREANYQALKAVNSELIGLYWDIGRQIQTWTYGTDEFLFIYLE